MRAWRVELDIRKNAVPDPNFKGEYGKESFAPSIWNDNVLTMMWKSVVPGSGAPESLILGAIQAVENKGRDISKILESYFEGLECLSAGDISKLRAITARIFHDLSRAKKIKDHPYHSFRRPISWKEVSKDFPRKCYKKRVGDERVFNGWLGQIAGASMGTRLEGYTRENLMKVYGDRLGYYLEIPPSTMNDDITYQIAVLETLRTSKSLSSKDLALKWLELIDFGWSAELMALENLRRGIFPPRSSVVNNPFNEWIGAQMRTMVHGLLSPSDPIGAARGAYTDSKISHSGNGLYGGIHSAVLTSLAFSIEDPQDLVLEAEKFVPKGSEFESVLKWTRNACQESTRWQDVLDLIEERFKTYNWIHVYPNAAVVITALWFSEGSFDKAMEIIAKAGFDVDCNAGEVGTIVGIISGVPRRWEEPLNDTLETYVEGYERIKISELAQLTLELSQG